MLPSQYYIFDMDIVCSTVYVLYMHILIGSMFGINVLDKDGVFATVVAAEMR